MNRGGSIHPSFPYNEVFDDSYLEFCADNWLDPDSIYVQNLWAERIKSLDADDR